MQDASHHDESPKQRSSSANSASVVGAEAETCVDHSSSPQYNTAGASAAVNNMNISSAPEVSDVSANREPAPHSAADTVARENAHVNAQTTASPSPSAADETAIVSSPGAQSEQQTAPVAGGGPVSANNIKRDAESSIEARNEVRALTLFA